MRRLGWFVVCWAFLQCCASAAMVDTQVSLEALRNAPDVIEIDGLALQLEAEVWRDFMPTLFPDEATRLKESATGPGRPMTATVRLRVQSDRPIQPDVNVDVAWVIFGEQVWESRPSEALPRDSAAHQITLYLRDGPKWPPGATVDIVVRVVDASRVTHLLSLRGQKIQGAV